MHPGFFFAPYIFSLLLLSYPSFFVFSAPSNNINDLPIGAIESTNVSKEQTNNMILYKNLVYGIKIRYPADWKLVECGDNNYHMLNVVAEFLQPDQNRYCSQNISASHNSLRVSVENYSAFDDIQSNTTIGNQLKNIGKHRLGAIGISCPGFDLRSYVSDAALAGSHAYKIKFDYSYLDNNKKAIEIWTVKNHKVYIID